MNTTRRQRSVRAALALGVGGLLCACAAPPQGQGPMAEAMGRGAMMKRPMAHARFTPTAADGAAGQAMFHEIDGPRLDLNARLTGLALGAPIGFALRDGACAAEAHAHPPSTPSTRVAPVLPTLEADVHGGLDVKRMADAASLDGVVGRVLLLQAGTGGPTLGCAVVARGHHGAH